MYPCKDCEQDVEGYCDACATRDVFELSDKWQDMYGNRVDYMEATYGPGIDCWEKHHEVDE